MNEDRLREAQRVRDAAAGPRVVEGHVVQGGRREPVQGEGWDHHEGMRRRPARRLEPWREDDDRQGYDPRYDRPDPRGEVNVSVHNDGAYYRPWKEELKLSAYKTAGNLLAWPFRLVKGFIETIVEGIAGLFGFVIKMLILPAILFLGYGLYQSGRDRPAAETAQIVGKESVGVVGGLFKGIWNGIFGSDEPKTVPNSDGPSKDAPAKR